MLADIRAKLSEVGKQSEALDSQFHLEVIDSMDELHDLNKHLQSDEKRKLMVSWCSKANQAFANT